MNTPKQAAEAWGQPRDYVDTLCRAWVEMYATDLWTLEELEQHLEVMLPIVMSTRGTEAS